MAEHEPVRLSSLHSRHERCRAEALLRAPVRAAGTAVAFLLRAGAWPRRRPVAKELRDGGEQGHAAVRSAAPSHPACRRAATASILGQQTGGAAWTASSTASTT